MILLSKIKIYATIIMSLIIENGDCLELMKSLPDNSVDLFICDLPYGETNCKWDSKIDLEQFWEQFRRLRKSKRTACIHFCSTKFGYTLIKSWEGGFKMDMVWKKRNKTGGLQSRHRPMRNHEMVYFFYEQAPKYNRDKYHKRIQTQNVGGGKNEHGFDCKGQSNHGEKSFEPPNPASVMEEKDPWGKKNGGDKGAPFGLKYDPPNPASVMEEDAESKNEFGWDKEVYKKKAFCSNFDPPNPASVVEEKYTQEHLDNNRGGAGTNGINEIFTKENQKKFNKENGPFDPPNPASVVEEDITYDNKKYKEGCVGRQKGKGVYRIDIPHKINNYDPPNPASVVEGDPRVNEKGKSAHGWDINHMDKPRVAHFDPKLPLSVVIPAEDEPVSMFESTKVFIGKRHHQTEKPQDILEFFIKYWTDEGDTILDPTMGSGSTGVACNKLKRNFIGFELDKTIFKVAEKRVNTKVI